MRIQREMLQSVIGRRVFVLSVACALVPIVALSVVGLKTVRSELEKQSERRLREMTAAVTAELIDHLTQFEGQLAAIDARSRAAKGLPSGDCEDETLPGLAGSVTSLAEATAEGEVWPICGPGSPPRATADMRLLIAAGAPFLWVERRRDEPPRLFVAAPRRGFDAPPRALLGAAAAEVVWGRVQRTLPPRTQVVVLDQYNRVLFSTLTDPGALVASINRSGVRFGKIDWSDAGAEHVAFHGLAYLRNAGFDSNWSVVLSERRAEATAAATSFTRTLPLIVLLTFGLVVLASLTLIRRSLHPLQQLKEGTLRISRSDFSKPVRVRSKDEFGELARSFNQMARQLDRQFRILSASAEIDRAVLSSLDREKIVATVLQRIPEFIPCTWGAVSLFHDGVPRAEVYTLGEDGPDGLTRRDTPLLDDERRFLETLDRKPLALLPGVVPPHLGPLIQSAGQPLVVLAPLRVKNRVAGVVTMVRSPGDRPPTSDELDDVRGVADQVSVALTNARLIETLEQLNWETLEAFALAIDALSPWTAGHSHRVTGMGLKLARHLGLDGERLDLLHRSALLHDIGKIGVPSSILDKPGALDADEMRAMREHVTIGARILEPLSAFTFAIPVARHHHEWWDGRGYPEGLAGEEIPFAARIVAVADVYDSLASERPYRPAWRLDRVIEFIRDGAGAQFDPQVVEAFLQVMEEEGRIPRRSLDAPALEAATVETTIAAREGGGS